MPRWIVATEDEEEASNSEEEEEMAAELGGLEAEDEAEVDEDDPGPSGAQVAGAEKLGNGKKREKISIPLGKLVCHVSFSFFLLVGVQSSDQQSCNSMNYPHASKWIGME